MDVSQHHSLSCLPLNIRPFAHRFRHMTLVVRSERARVFLKPTNSVASKIWSMVARSLVDAAAGAYL